DGLSNKLGPAELKQIVEQTPDLKTACRVLINVANERGGEDNITVVLARFDGDSLQAASDSQTITGSLMGTHEDFFASVGNSYAAPPPDPGATSMLRARSREELPPTEELPPLPAPPVAAAMAIEPEAATPYISPEFIAPGQIQYPKKSYTAIILAAIGALLL